MQNETGLALSKMNSRPAYKTKIRWRGFQSEGLKPQLKVMAKREEWGTQKKKSNSRKITIDITFEYEDKIKSFKEVGKRDICSEFQSSLCVNQGLYHT